MIPPDQLSKLTEDQQRRLLEQLLQERAAERHHFPMSMQQQALWYDYRRDPAQRAFNVFLPSRLRGRLDVDALRRAVDKLVGRHASLRTTFDDPGGKPQSRVHAELPPEFRVVDATGWDDSTLRTKVGDEAYRPFDLERGPMLRMALFRCAHEVWISVATAHHIAVDFWSLILMLSEIRQLYPAFESGGSTELADATNNYDVFVRRQRDLLRGTRGSQLRGYWRSQIGRTATALDWPTDFIRPKQFTGHGSAAALEVSQDTVERLEQLSRRCGVTFQASILAVLQVLVHRYTGQSSFFIGAPFAGRPHQAFESTVGFFVNMLPLRAEIDDELTFSQVLGGASRSLLGALEHQDLPLSEILRESTAPRDPGRSPLFQVSCTFEKSHLKQERGRAGYLFPNAARRTSMGGVEQESFAVPVRTCHHDLEFIFERDDSVLRGMIVYCRDLFEHASIELLAKQFTSLCQQLVRYPDRKLREVPWAEAPARRRSSGDSNGTPTKLLLNEFMADAATGPEQVAFATDEAEVSYRTLADQVDRLAASLRDRRIADGTYVPVIGQRGPGVIAPILGVIRAGATVVPLDVDQPAVTLAQLKDETAADVILVDTPATRERVAHEAEGLNLSVLTVDSLLADTPVAREVAAGEPSADQLCYLIYTSGSTGRPKGVLVDHGAIDNTLRWRQSHLSIDRGEAVLVLLSHQFDAGFALILSALLGRGQLLWPEKSASDPDAIVESIQRNSIRLLAAVPGLLSLIVDHPQFERCQSLRQLWTGGEQMPADLPQRVRARNRLPLWNLYGPTEAAVEVAAKDVIDHDSRRPVPIGSPIWNSALLVLDGQRRTLPVNVPGELAIAGAGLARGYLNRPGLTSDRFVKLNDGRRVFLTGDRVRELPDGNFEFLGRIDHQIKIAGYRIELEEIEHVLSECVLVRKAAVHACSDSYGSNQLVCSIVLDPETPDGWLHEGEVNPEIIRQIKRFVGDRLPRYKHPQRYQVVPSIPTTSSGKVDRQRLREMPADHPPLDEPSEPRTSLEAELVLAWSDSLGLSAVGAHENYFDLGGTSLQAASLAAQLSEKLGVRVPTSLIFDLGEPGQVAQRLASLYPESLAERFGREAIRFHQQDVAPGEPSQHRHPLLAKLTSETTRPVQVSASDQLQPNEHTRPLFLIHPPGGIVVCYRELADRCGQEQPIYAVRSRGLHGAEDLPETLELMAAEYAEAIRQEDIGQPIRLGGWSLGGIIAYEVARQLRMAGHDVDQLVLLDTALPDGIGDAPGSDSGSQVGLEYGIAMTLQELGQLREEEQLPLLWEHARQLGLLDEDAPQSLVDAVLRDLRHLFHHHVRLVCDYQLTPFDIPVLLIRPRDVPFDVGTSADRGWSNFVSQLQVKFVNGHHHSMMSSPNVDQVAELLCH